MYTSIHFLLLLSTVIIVNYLIPRSYRWILLLVSSCYFYLDWQPIYFFLLLITSLITYFSAKLLGRDYKKNTRKIICILGSGLPLGSLIFFKYYGFITNNVKLFLEFLGIYIEFPAMSLLLPLGISFYTFSAIGYLIDIYNYKYAPEKNFGLLFLFISFFAQILSGPIPRGNQLIPQLKKPGNLSYDNILGGFRILLWGMFMKLCVADNLAIYVDNVYSNLNAQNGGSIFLASTLYTFQIYCDFAGYSFMALGCGRMLGIKLMENFRRPYLARNIKDFWGRWHISLSTWFRDYIYIPLGGNRVSKKRNRLNLFITFILSGIWHGASWNFILWGGFHGSGQIVQKSFPGHKIKLPPYFLVFLTFSFVSLCWVFFRLESLDQIKTFFHKLFFDFGFPAIDAVAFYGLITLLFVIIKDLKDEYFPQIKLMHSENFWVSNIFTGLFLGFIVLFGKFGNGSFIYFNF